METTNIYILELVGKRYYIGKSNDPESRFNHHLKVRDQCGQENINL